MNPSPIDKHIAALGGLHFFIESAALSESERIGFIDQKGISAHTELLDFIDQYGGQSFNQSVCCSMPDDIPSYPSGKIPLSTFLGFVEGAFGLLEIDDLVSDNIPAGYIAFAMGDPTGDYWVYHPAKKSIHFWQHDAPEEEDLFFAAHTIADFILNCEIETASSSENTIVDFWMADEDEDDFVVGEFEDDYFDN